MTFFKINNHDYSKYVNMLKVGKQHNYTIKTSALGSEKVTYRTTKRVIEVGIIPLDSEALMDLMADINSSQVTISYLEPETNELVENIRCIIPSSLVEYYTIRAGKTQTKAFSFQIQELAKA